MSPVWRGGLTQSANCVEPGAFNDVFEASAVNGRPLKALNRPLICHPPRMAADVPRWSQGGTSAAILGGWQINGLFSAFSGRPFTALASNTSLNAPGSTQFADCVRPPRQT